MALFSLHINCDGIGSYITQCHGENPYDAAQGDAVNRAP